VRVPSFSPATTTFPLPIYHTTTTMSREGLRPRNLNVNYLPPPLILSSPPSSPKNLKKQSAKHCIMDNHSGPKRTSSQPPPPPTGVQHQPVIIPDVSALTTEAPPAMLNLDDNYSSSEEAYIEPAGSITAGHSAKPRKKMVLYDLRGSRRSTEITKLTHRLRTHSGRLIHESSLATATTTGICNHELPWTSMVFQALMYIKKTELFLR